MRAPNIFDITPDNFQQVVLDASQHRIVVVDFWAESVEQCKEIAPILEKIAGENQEHMLLARIDCETQQQIVAQFGVRSLPTVAVIKDGQPVDGFAGVQPEAVIREMLEKHLPNPEDELLGLAQQALTENDLGQALTYAKQAFAANESRIETKFMLIHCLIENGRTDDAEALLGTVTMVDQDGTYQSLLSKLELAKQAADSPEIQALQSQVAADPDNADLILQLAVQLQQVNRTEEALESVLSLLRKDLGNAEAKKVMLDIINALPDGDALAAKYRRQLFSLMY